LPFNLCKDYRLDPTVAHCCYLCRSTVSTPR